MYLHICATLILKIITTSCTTYSNVTDVAVSIANSIFYRNDITLVIWNQSDFEHVTDFLAEYDGLVSSLKTTEKNVTLPLQNGLNYKQITFFVESFKQFEYYIDESSKWRSTAVKAIIIVAKELNITLLAKIASEHDVSEAVFLYQSDGQVTISTYLPFRSQDDCNNYTPVTLHSIEEVRETFVKKYQNYQKCPIKTIFYNNFLTLIFEEENGTVSNINGPDAEIINAIIVNLNASLEVVSIVKNDRQGNGTTQKVNSIFMDFTNRKADIFFPALSLNVERYKVAQISSIYKFVDIGWAIPKLPVVYPLGKILHPMFNNVTPLLSISFAIFVIVTKFIRRFHRNNAELNNDILFDSYQIFLGQEAPFESRSSLLNSMFVMWIWFSIIVRLVYQSDLTSGLQTEISQISFETFAEANQVISDYGGVVVFKQFLIGTPLEKDYRVIPLIEVPRFVQELHTGKKFLMASDVSSMYQGKVDIDFVKTPLATLGSCFYMRPSWPGAKRFDTLLKRTLEAGLVDKVYLKPKGKAAKHETSETKPLTMKFLGIIFIGYIILIIICVAVFIGEIVYYKICTRNLFPYVD